MHPILFKIGTFEVRSYGVMLVLGFYAGMLLATKLAPRNGLKPSVPMDSVIWLIGFGILGARLFFIAQEWGYYSTHLDELRSIRFNGLTSFGGYVFGFIALVLWCRIKQVSLSAMMDTLSPGAVLANAIGRIGCLLNACCFGHKCAPGAFGVHQEGYPGLYQPAQAYETLINLVSWVIVMKMLSSRGVQRGQATGLSFIALGLGRFIVEYWRAGTQLEVTTGLASSSYLGSLPITDAQVFALLFVAFGAIWWWIQARKASLNETENPSEPVESLD